MFVKVVTLAPKGGSHRHDSLNLYQCTGVHLDFLKPDNPNEARILMMPSALEVAVMYREDGSADKQVFVLNDDGQTIDRIA